LRPKSITLAVGDSVTPRFSIKPDTVIADQYERREGKLVCYRLIGGPIAHMGGDGLS
jgi:hypothetical protein